MKFETERLPIPTPALRYLTYGIAALILTVIHLVLLGYIQIDGLTPDLLLILCVWIALKEGQFTGIIAAFCIGLFYDLVSGNVLGSNALAKTCAAFVAGFFYKENLTDYFFRNYSFLLIVLLSSFIHNIFYFLFRIKSSDVSFIPFFLKFGVAVSLYTTVFASIVLLVSIPRRGLIR